MTGARDRVLKELNKKAKVIVQKDSKGCRRKLIFDERYTSYTCDVSQKKFGSKNLIRLHIQTVHVLEFSNLPGLRNYYSIFTNYIFYNDFDFAVGVQEKNFLSELQDYFFSTMNSSIINDHHLSIQNGA